MHGIPPTLTDGKNLADLIALEKRDPFTQAEAANDALHLPRSAPGTPYSRSSTVLFLAM